MDQVKPKRIALRRSAFRAWLSSRGSDIVGYACEDGSCPIAMWLQDVHGTPFSVGNYTYNCVSFSVTRPLPLWAGVFVRVLDFTYPFLNEVKGAEVLSILDEVEHSLASESPEVCMSSSDDVSLCNVPAREHAADKEGSTYV